MKEPIDNGGRPARDLAKDLLPQLEAVANLHYLLDAHVTNPERLRELRSMEDLAFDAMLRTVLAALRD